jgi:hypothetical protein
MLDANSQQIIATSESGYPYTIINVGSKFGTQSMLFPTSCSVGAIVVSGTGTTASDTDNIKIYVDLYVSELLGKIWKIRIPYNLAGMVLADDITSPTSLLDKSSFPTSIRVRELVYETNNNVLSSKRQASATSSTMVAGVMTSEWVPAFQYQLTP